MALCNCHRTGWSDRLCPVTHGSSSAPTWCSAVIPSALVLFTMPPGPSSGPSFFPATSRSISPASSVSPLAQAARNSAVLSKRTRRLHRKKMNRYVPWLKGDDSPASKSWRATHSAFKFRTHSDLKSSEDTHCRWGARQHICERHQPSFPPLRTHAPQSSRTIAFLLLSHQNMHDQNATVTALRSLARCSEHTTDCSQKVSGLNSVKNIANVLVL